MTVQTCIHSATCFIFVSNPHQPDTDVSVILSLRTTVAKAVSPTEPAYAGNSVSGFPLKFNLRYLTKVSNYKPAACKYTSRLLKISQDTIKLFSGNISNFSPNLTLQFLQRKWKVLDILFR